MLNLAQAGKNELIYNSIKEENDETNRKLKQSTDWTLPYIHMIDDNWSTGVPWVQERAGTEGDPHIIENITIYGNNLNSCIYMENCSKFFKIRNCFL